MNMSGPANLHLLLRYWGENRDPEPYLQPNSRDETVMFYEMVDYIENRTGLAATLRMGGDIDTLKALLRSGIPVMVQIGYDNPEPDGWAGHYTIVNGYEERAGSLILVATFPEDGTDTPIAYDEFQRNWRAFNYSYMLVYPTEKAAEVTTILGKQADEVQNYHWAAEKADAEAALLTSGRDLFFAWYNRGTSLTYLEDYVGAKKAFEKAFSIYETLPFEERPWRMLWYQTRPYWAFFYTGSFQKVIEMATSTLESVGEPLLEESFYWRALAKEALGDLEGAISDLSEAIRLNPNFIAGKYQLRRLQGES
jgi:tetratricopeptide (TPR) repeat protein